MISTTTRLLIVDDSTVMRKLMITILKTLGFLDFLEAKNGAIAFQSLQESTPPVGLILSDLTMPETNGIEFLKLVKADSKFARLPFVMITAEREEASIKEALDLGATSYLLKPINAEIVKALIERL